jgi:hypothetical protein
VEDGAAGADHHIVVSERQDQLTVFLAISRLQGRAQNFAETDGQSVKRMVDDLLRVQPGDLSGLIIKYRDALIGAGGDYAGG